MICVSWYCLCLYITVYVLISLSLLVYVFSHYYAFVNLIGFGRRRQISQYSEWGMRGWSVLGSVPLMSSGVFIRLSSWLAG